MIDITQLLNDPVVQQAVGSPVPLIDILRPLVGFAGIPAIRQIVEYTKTNWWVNSTTAPIVALVCGVLLNLTAGGLTGMTFGQSLVVGLFVGAGASGWHWLVSPPKPPQA